MIVVTGTSSFIGRALIHRLNADNFNAIVATDDFGDAAQNKNLQGLKIRERVHYPLFFDWLEKNAEFVEFIFHFGSRVANPDSDLDYQAHIAYSQKIWEACVRHQIPLIYASSAATYGLGGHGYVDDEAMLDQLCPLTAYGRAKHQFDLWVTQQKEKPFFWAGLKFFDVYGCSEAHEDPMASFVRQAYREMAYMGKIRLFKSHRADYQDGGQMRDFIYVKDVAEICFFFIQMRKKSGIYNVGTGVARSFLDVANAVSQAMGKPPQIEFVDMPEGLRNIYRYFVKADITKLVQAGYTRSFYGLEAGVKDLVETLGANAPREI